MNQHDKQWMEGAAAYCTHTVNIVKKKSSNNALHNGKLDVMFQLVYCPGNHQPA
jgi:hypothetical protein